MYCDGCGSPFSAGAQFCMQCGKRIVTAPVGSAAGAARGVPTASAMVAGGDGRVGRNINLLAGLWLANGILRLMEVGWLMAFRRLIFDGGWWQPGGWPLHFGPFFMGGLFFGGATLALFGIIHLLLAWGLYERQSWARILGIVIGFLALIRFPFGTALGIYTLWVLLPEGSAREYDAITGVGGQVHAAKFSA